MLTDQIFSLLQKREELEQQINIAQLEIYEINEQLEKLYLARDRWDKSGVKNRAFENKFKAQTIAEIIDI